MPDLLPIPPLVTAGPLVADLRHDGVPNMAAWRSATTAVAAHPLAARASVVRVVPLMLGLSGRTQ